MSYMKRVTKERCSCINLAPRVLSPWSLRREGKKRYPAYECDLAFVK